MLEHSCTAKAVPQNTYSSGKACFVQVDDRLQDMRQVRDELLALERQCLEALDRGSTWQVQHAVGHGDSLAQTLEQFSMDLQVKLGSASLWTYRRSWAQRPSSSVNTAPQAGASDSCSRGDSVCLG